MATKKTGRKPRGGYANGSGGGPRPAVSINNSRSSSSSPSEELVEKPSDLTLSAAPVAPVQYAPPVELTKQLTGSGLPSPSIQLNMPVETPEGTSGSVPKPPSRQASTKGAAAAAAPGIAPEANGAPTPRSTAAGAPIPSAPPAAPDAAAAVASEGPTAAAAAAAVANGDNTTGLQGPAFQVPLEQLAGSRVLSGVLPANLGSGPLEVLGAWYHLYAPSKAGDIDHAVARHWAKGSNFEDNLIQVCGPANIAAQFKALALCFKRVQPQLEKVQLLAGETLAGGGDPKADVYKLRVLSRLEFYWPWLIRGPLTSLVLPEALTVWTTTTLTIKADEHMVQSHQEEFHNLPTLPWLVRWGIGTYTSVVERLLLRL